MFHILAHVIPGLEHATIRDNIVFGCAYGFDEARYQEVIEACALTKDLEVLDAGDRTGECYNAIPVSICSSRLRNR